MKPAKRVRVRADDLDATAIEAYLYGFPLLLMDAAARHATAGQSAGFNRFLHCFDLAETCLRAIVLPGRDLVCSVAWLDLRAGPVVLTSLQTDSYYVMSLIDAWTNVFATLGTRATGNADHRFAITGPHFTGPVPANCTRISAPTNLVCIVAQSSVEDVSRTQVLAALDERYRLEPSGTKSLRLEPACALRDVDTLPAEEAFSRIRELMTDNPSTRADSSAVEALESKVARQPPLPLRRRAGRSTIPRLMQIRADGPLTQVPDITASIICDARAPRDITSSQAPCRTCCAPKRASMLTISG